MDSEEFNRLYRVWKTVQKMLFDRGYAIAEQQLNLPFSAFRSKFEPDPTLPSDAPPRTRETALSFVVGKRDNHRDRIFVFFSDDNKISVSVVSNYAQRLNREEIERAIIIYKGTVTPTAKQGIQDLQPFFFIEYFDESELVVNITEHELVPQHVVLSVDEKKALLRRYKVKETQLPKIQTSDPVGRYYGLSKGQVVKITRNSETAGKYVTYRLAI